MRTLLLVALFITVGLAGCAQSEEPDAAPSADVARIEGVVVDPAIAPISNATVRLAGTNATQQTDGNGMFAFTVAPGTFLIRVEHAAYVATEVQVTVPANGTSPMQVDIQMEHIPTVSTFANVLKWDGIIQCAARYSLNALAACGLVYDTAEGAGLGGALGAVADDAEERYPEITTPPSLVQSDMVWESTQAAGEGLRLMFTDDHRAGADNYAVAAGPSPLSVRADNRTLMFKHLDSQGLLIRVFPGDVQGTGLGVTVAQRFSVFTSTYYGYAPPEDWRFTDDSGLYPPP